ncbi:imidazole glycerol phosphate synthase subunit HisF [Portibacter marinus]|uniref:imidazole glycerol phosphate synthase subunit HisF n=1 Tax=Portibacter marinus TaxID=2898660 RepID=UPI001F26B43F|nr:imidazole glycerol phosphate synthase subunit HisF [Portibacter marinus]
MLSKRIIPCLDIKDGRTVKGVNFLDLVDAGDPVEQGRIYAEQGADELVFLDITATADKRKTIVDLVTKVARNVNIPFTVGGGISSVEDAYAALQAGADKVSINSAAVRRPELLDECSANFGNQCIVLAVDAKFIKGEWIVHLVGGRKATEVRLYPWIKEAVSRGAGEILFTSMDHDGTKNGFANESLKEISMMVDVPLIASGGAGSKIHFKEVFERGQADAALAASVFHFGEISIPELKAYLEKEKINVRIN